MQIDPSQVVWDDEPNAPATGTAVSSTQPTVSYKGKKYPLGVPSSASDAELQAAARKLLSDLGISAPEAVIQRPEIIEPGMETPEETAQLQQQTAEKAKAEKEISVPGAFARGFMEPRKNDPFGLDPDLYAKYGISAPIMAGGRGLIELGESIGYGLTDAAGQALYNLGLTSEDPRRVGGTLREVVNVGSAALPATPLSAGAADVGLIPAMVRRAAPAAKAAPRALTPQQELAQIAERYGIRALPADVSGPVVKGATELTGSTIFGAGPIRTAAKEQQADFGQAVERLAAEQGAPLEAAQAGQTVRTAAESYATKSSQQGGRLYKRAEDLIGDLRFVPENALQEVRNNIARLEKQNDPTNPLLVKLRNMESQLSLEGGFDYEAFKDIWSGIKRQAYDPSLVTTNAERVMGDIAKAFKNDAAVNLADNPAGLRAWERANKFWTDRVETLNDVFEPILGKGRSGEEILGIFDQMLRGKRGGVDRLSRAVRELPKKSAGDLRATLIDRLGRPAAQEGAEIPEFSTSTFLSNWDRMTRPAKNALFGADPDLKRSLDELARFAKETAGNKRYLTDGEGGRGRELFRAAELLIGSGSLGTLIVGEKLSGLALSSPRLVRLLARMPQVKTPQAVNSFRQSLAALAAREPALNADIQRISDALGGERQEEAQPLMAGEEAPAPEEAPIDEGAIEWEDEGSPIPANAFGGGEEYPDPFAFDAGKITSGRRTPEGNALVGGVAHSAHLSGSGVDYVPAQGQSMDELEAETRAYFGEGVKVLNEGDHIHVELPGYGAMPYMGAKGSTGAI